MLHALILLLSSTPDVVRKWFGLGTRHDSNSFYFSLFYILNKRLNLWLQSFIENIKQTEVKTGLQTQLHCALSLVFSSSSLSEMSINRIELLLNYVTDILICLAQSSMHFTCKSSACIFLRNLPARSRFYARKASWFQCHLNVCWQSTHLTHVNFLIMQSLQESK